MALTTTTDWKRTVTRSSHAPRVLMEIDDGTNQWYCQNDKCDNVSHDPALLRVDSISAKFDPVDRKTQMGRMSVTVSDAWLRPILSSNRLKGSKVTLLYGDKETPHTSFASTSFVKLFTGVYDDELPDPSGETVVIECLDTWTVIADAGIRGAWEHDHPMEVIEDIISTKLGIDSSLFDATSLDPSDSANAANSHLCIFRAQPASTAVVPDSTVWTSTSGFELVSELMQITDAGLFVNEDGKMTVKVFDATEASVADWDDSVISDLRQVDNGGENMINRVSIAVAGSGTNALGVNGQVYRVDYHYTQDDTTSQGDHAASSIVGSERIVEKPIENPWIMGGVGQLRIAIDNSTTSIRFWNGYGMAGMRSFLPTASQPADAKPSASRPVYLMIQNDDGFGYEIVKVTSAFLNTSNTTRWWAYADPYQDPPVAVAVADGHEIFATVARGQMGTSAVSHIQYAEVIDITAAEFMASRLIERYGDSGAPTIEVDLPISEFAVQIGELVTVTWPRYLSYNTDGLTTSTKWQVIGKEPMIFDSPPRVTFTLMRATVS